MSAPLSPAHGSSPRRAIAMTWREAQHREIDRERRREADQGRRVGIDGHEGDRARETDDQRQWCGEGRSGSAEQRAESRRNEHGQRVEGGHHGRHDVSERDGAHGRAPEKRDNGGPHPPEARLWSEAGRERHDERVHRRHDAGHQHGRDQPREAGRHQAGEGLAHLGAFPDGEADLKGAVDLAARDERVYLDTSGIWIADFLAYAAERVPEKLIWGSDCPLTHPRVAWRFVTSVVKDDRLLAKIGHETAKEVYG